MSFYDQIFENNKKWLASKKVNNKQFFAKLAEGQSPDVLYIGCSDSRVTAEELMGAEAGQVFVHRNIANVVSTIDLSAMSVIEYAVTHLKVKHIVVCGHYHCGGVKAAMVPQDLGLLNPWIRNIRDVYRLHKESLDSITDEEQRYQRLVELNVEEQAFNVLKTAAVQKSVLATGFPKIHGWVFDVGTGELLDQHIDFSKKLNNMKEVYNLAE